MSEVLINDGNHKTIDIDGLKIDMSASIGDFFAKKIVAELTEKDFEKIYDFVISDIFFPSLSKDSRNFENEEDRRKYVEEFGKFGDVKTKDIYSDSSYNRTKYLPDYI